MRAPQKPRGPVSARDVPDAADATDAANASATSPLAQSAVGAASGPAAAGSGDASFVTGSHESLFAADASDEASRCDVCGAKVEEEADEGYAVSGHGLYVWSRGGDVRYEEPPLCPACAVAVGLSAMARWEIEEEEG